MTPKKSRLDRASIAEVFKFGKFIGSPSLSLKFILNKGILPPRFSFIAPSSVAKDAVMRNKLRRRGYLALEAHLPQFPAGIIGVFIFGKNSKEIFGLSKNAEAVSKIKAEIKNILNKLRY